LLDYIILLRFCKLGEDRERKDFTAGKLRLWKIALAISKNMAW
jgi:hypothetical protein